MHVLLIAIVFMFSSHNVDTRWKVVQPYNDKLNRMAQCESTSRWWIVTRTKYGTYYGGLQFTLSTWHSVGGKGYPNKNSILEQKFRAVKLIKLSGYSPWPNCG